MPTSTAVVATDASARYAKQLLAHLGRKNPVEDVEGVPHARRLVFAYGSGVVRAEPARLVLEATAVDAESLARVEDVLGRHLVRFGQRQELTVEWAARSDPRSDPPSDARSDPRSDPPSDPRPDPRPDPRSDPPSDPQEAP